MIKYYTPSYKRHNNVKVAEWLKSVVVCVHDFESDKYKENYDNILIIPDALKGNMAKVRNFILDSCDTDVCVMLDDDVEFIGYYEKGEQYIITESELTKKIIEWYFHAIALNTVLFGINLQVDPKFYREFSPMSLLSPVLGTFCCIIKNDLRYDERLGLNEDYDYSLQVLHKYHKILRWNKFHYKAGHLKEKGGCGAYRILDEEKKQADIMIGKWGSKVVKYDFKRSTNPVINCPLKGV